MFIVHEYEEGFWVYVPENGPDFQDLYKVAKAAGYSGSLTDLLTLIEDIRDIGQPIHWLKLDRDGPVIDKLPKHDW